MKTEDRSHPEIPTVPDIVAGVSGMMADCALGTPSGMSADVICETVAKLMTTNTSPETDMIDRVAYAHGCHAMADAYRRQGDHENAGLYHAIAQDLLTLAANDYATMIAIGLDLGRTPRH